MTSPTVACLLPARNAATDLAGWFESVSCVADVVVALDDGSTDDTAALLEAHPLVHTLLRNPVRPSYEGWDDSANRQRLIDALEPIGPRWILQLDADERIDAADALALREFLAPASGDERRAPPDPTCIYLLGICRMIGDQQHWDRLECWAGRVFAYRAGITLPAEKLHFSPVPTDITMDRYVRTTIRIQHLANLTAERRAGRHRKYAEVDPAALYQSSYAHLLDDPTSVKEWTTRSDHQPIILHGATTAARCWSIGPIASVDSVNVQDRGDLRVAVESSSADLVVLHDGASAPSDELLDRLRSLPSSYGEYAMFRVDPSSVAVTLGRMLADERDPDDPGSAPHSHPGRCQVIRRAVLVELLSDSVHFIDPNPDNLTDAVWAKGYGAACLGPIGDPFRSGQQPRHTLCASARQGKLRAHRAVAAERERAPHRHLPTHLFGTRAAFAELRSIARKTLRDRSAGAVFGFVVRFLLLAFHIAVQHVSARRTLDRMTGANEQTLREGQPSPG